MNINDLLKDPGRRRYAGAPEADALAQADALQEADLRDVNLSLATSSVSMLFDLREALQFRMANVAVIKLVGVRSVSMIDGDPPGDDWYTHHVMSSKPELKGNLFSLGVSCLQNFRINVEAQAAEFFVGDMLSLSEAPPNLSEEDEQTIRAGMPAWDSEFLPKWATFIDASS